MLINDTPVADFVIHIGAPKPIQFQIRQTRGGTLRAFDSTLKMRVTYPTSTINLAVGSGITLSNAEGVTNAVVTAQLTVAQSRFIPEGNFASYEIQEGVVGSELPVLMGALVGRGGANSDV